MRLAMVILLLSPAVAFGQAKQDDEDKVSNDNPARPLQMPPASTEVKEAIDDFERFSRRSAWERALKAIYTIPETQAQRFVDGDNGFIIPVERKRRLLLTGLPPAGQAAYRLFYDAEAREAASTRPRARRAQEPRAHLLRLFHDVGRRQRRRSPGRSLLRARTLRSRRRLLAGDLARAPRYRVVARSLVGEGCPGAERAGRRAEFEQVKAELVESLQRREDHPGRRDRRAGRAARSAHQGGDSRSRQRHFRSGRFHSRAGPAPRRHGRRRPGSCGSRSPSKPA